MNRILKRLKKQAEVYNAQSIAEKAFNITKNDVKNNLTKLLNILDNKELNIIKRANNKEDIEKNDDNLYSRLFWYGFSNTDDMLRLFTNAYYKILEETNPDILNQINMVYDRINSTKEISTLPENVNIAWDEADKYFDEVQTLYNNKVFNLLKTLI